MSLTLFEQMTSVMTPSPHQAMLLPSPCEFWVATIPPITSMLSTYFTGHHLLGHQCWFLKFVSLQIWTHCYWMNKWMHVCSSPQPPSSITTSYSQTCLPKCSLCILAFSRNNFCSHSSRMLQFTAGQTYCLYISLLIQQFHSWASKWDNFNSVSLFKTEQLAMTYFRHQQQS
jgi:hypothetical protein